MHRYSHCRVTSASQTQPQPRLGDGPAPGVAPRRPRWRPSEGLAARVLGLWPALIVLAPLVLIAYSFWPGHMSADTLAQIDQADTGDYTNQHAPILMFLWHPFYDLGLGPGWALGLQLLVFGLACFLLLRSVLSRRAAAIGTAVICLSPVVFGMLGYLSRDVWFTELTLLTFACALRTVTSARHRRRWLIVTFTVAWLTLASRQNAGAAIFLALAVVIAPVLPIALRSGRRRIPAAVTGGLLATVALMVTLVPVNAAIGVRDVNPEQYLYIYDVAALSHQDQENLFPREVMPQGGIEPINTFWNVDSVNPYLFSAAPPIATPLADDAVVKLRTAWLDSIGNDPLGYVRARTDLMLRQLAIGRRATFIYHPGVDQNGQGFVVTHPEANRQARDYVEGFADDALDGGVLYPLWLYLAAAIVSGLYLLRTRRPGLVVVGALGLAGLTAQAGLFLAAMGTQYRFEFAMVAIAIITTVVAVAAWSGQRRARSISASSG